MGKDIRLEKFLDAVFRIWPGYMGIEMANDVIINEMLLPCRDIAQGYAPQEKAIRFKSGYFSHGFFQLFTCDRLNRRAIAIGVISFGTIQYLYDGCFDHIHMLFTSSFFK